MAKKDKDALFNDYLAELKAINPQLEEVLKDEKVSAKLREGVLARADYSSSMDQLRAERENFEAQVAEARAKIEGWQKWYGDTSTEFAKSQEKLDAYRKTYGDLDGNQPPARQNFLTREDFDKDFATRSQQRELSAMKFADDLTDIKIDYRERFGERLNSTDIYNLATSRGVDLVTAYNLYIGDRVREQQKAQFDEAIKQAREEGARDFASAHKLPIVPSSSDITHYVDVKDTPKTARDRIAAALSDFTKR